MPALLVGVGSTIADLVYVGLVYLGVAPLVDRSVFRILLNGAAAGVLGLLAWGAFQEFRHPPDLPGSSAEPPSSRPRGAFAAGFFVTLSNPLTVVFYLSFFGGAVASLHQASRWSHLVFVTGVTLGCFLWSLFLAGILGLGHGRVGPRLRRGISLVSLLALTFFSLQFLLHAILEVIHRGE